MANLDRMFDHHPPRNKEEGEVHAKITAKFKELAVWLEKHLPENEEKVLVYRTLIEARMEANACVALDRYDQENQ